MKAHLQLSQRHRCTKSCKRAFQPDLPVDTKDAFDDPKDSIVDTKDAFDDPKDSIVDTKDAFDDPKIQLLTPKMPLMTQRFNC